MTLQQPETHQHFLIPERFDSCEGSFDLWYAVCQEPGCPSADLVAMECTCEERKRLAEIEKQWRELS